MTIDKIDITLTLANAKNILTEDKTISPSSKAVFELLLVVIGLLLNKLGMNSTNSSVPPSQDLKRKKGSKKKTSGEKRKPGGQDGHGGTNLKQVANPDQIETLEIDRRTIPDGQYTPMGFEVRQVIDIKISKIVTEYRAEILQDQNGNQFVARFPDEITRPAQYGKSVKAQAVYMSQQQLIPYDRIRDYFSDQCAIPLSPGSVFNFNKQAFNLLEKFEAIAKTQLVLQPLLHVDETGINVNGKTLWLHSASNNLWTMFFPHEKRGGIAMQAMGILEKFRGILCHDHWKPYFKFNCLHALCNAHHLRELERAFEQDGQKWAKKMQALLIEMNNETTKANGLLAQTNAQQYVSKYQNILEEGDVECPPPATKKPDGKRGRTANTKSRNLLERLRKFQTETLLFMTNKIVPFTNNQGENDIRMTKVQQKISGCFRSLHGAQIFCRIRGYLSTCRKHSMQPTEALQILFSGKLPEFVPKIE